MQTKSSLKPSRRFFQFLILTSFSCILLILYNPISGRRIQWSIPVDASQQHFHPPIPESGRDSSQHPIDELIASAEAEFETLKNKRVETVAEAAGQYRKRRGRHPPPGFDRWFNFAAAHGAFLVEDFFDQIYHDLGPLWKEDKRPRDLRQLSYDFQPRISVRAGNVTIAGNAAKTQHPRMALWSEIIHALQTHLPDVDIPLNLNNEPALLVSWKKINDAMINTRHFKLSPSDIIDEFSGITDADKPSYRFDPKWLTERVKPSLLQALPRVYWTLVRRACDSKTRGGAALPYFDIWNNHTIPEHMPAHMFPTGFPNGTFHGYIKNWTVATDACSHPDLQGLHGAFVRPKSIQTSKKHFPLFSASKFSMNNDILLPSPSDWNASSPTEDSVPKHAWVEKKDVLFWRGPASGGRNTEENWQRFHRHRFMSMLNSSQVSTAAVMLRHLEDDAKGVGPAQNFRLSVGNTYNLTTQENGDIGEWVGRWADAQFTDLVCDSDPMASPANPRHCAYNERFYSTGNSVPRWEEDDYKYIPVLDGDAGPDDLIGALRSGSVPIRATVFRSWFESRLVPWLHFVPMDNTFADLYGIMEYFVGSSSGNEHTAPRELLAREGTDGTLIEEAQRPPLEDHDSAAQKIAEAGRNWAGKVLRREDMLIYVYRLLLEYARVVDDRRERMGWVGDLVQGKNDAT